MPTNYTVKQGDTLSKIAANYGVSSSQISGYKSGNPNLIYPGEQLVIPTAEPVQPTQPPTQPVVNATGLTGEPLLETAEKTGYNEPVTSPYTTDIAAILEQQKKLVESTQGNNVPTVSTTAEGLGYGTTQSEADALIPEINSLQQQMADLNSQEQKAIAALLNKPTSAGFAMGMESRIKRQYAVEKSAVSANLGVKVALAEMLQGKADKMWSHAQDIVNDLTAKDDANVKDIERFYALNRDTLNYLTAQEKTYLDNIREDAKLVAKNAREDYTNKVSGIFAAAKEGLDVSAISGDDISNKSYEDIIAMISNAAQKKLAQDRAQALALKNTAVGTTAANVDQNTLDAVMANPQLYFTLPIHTREAVATALQSQGYDISQLQSPAFVGKSKEKIAAFNSAVAMTNTLETLWNATTPAASWATALIQAPGKLVGGVTGKDEAVKLYENQKSAFLSMISRALGEKGVLTDYDLARVERALPKIGDNASIAQKDFATLEQILEDIKIGTTSTYGGVSTTPTTTGGISDEQLNSFLNGIGF